MKSFFKIQQNVLAFSAFLLTLLALWVVAATRLHRLGGGQQLFVAGTPQTLHIPEKQNFSYTMVDSVVFRV